MISLLLALSLTAADGKSVAAAWTPAAGAGQHPAIVMVSAPGEPPDEWSAAAVEFAKQGISTLAIRPRTLAKDAAIAGARADVDGALAWLRARKDVDGHRLFVGGDGEGALIALAAADSDKDVLGFAAVSAKLEPARFDDESAMHALGDRPVFLALARGDKPAAKSALVLSSYAKGASHLEQGAGDARGAAVLGGDALDALTLWLKQVSGLAPPAKPDE